MTTTKTTDVAGGILVGHDGSTFSEQALSWALRLAAALEMRVTVVRAWVLTNAPRPDSWEPGYMPPMTDFEKSTQAALEEDTRAAREEYPGLDVRCVAVHGRPAARLIEATENAEMVVVGRRGLGGFTGLVLGSVSNQVVTHARCAVLVAGPRSDDDSTPPARLEPDREVADARD